MGTEICVYAHSYPEFLPVKNNLGSDGKRHTGSDNVRNSIEVTRLNSNLCSTIWKKFEKLVLPKAQMTLCDGRSVRFVKTLPLHEN